MIKKGFTLAELLVGLVLLALLLPPVLEGGRWFLLASRHLSGWLLARNRAQRALSFIEPRALHCGLGLSACRDPAELRRALAGFADLKSPVLVYGEWPYLAKEADGISRGEAFAFLYAQPSGVFLGTSDGNAFVLSPGESASFEILKGSLAGAGFLTRNEQNLKSWGVLPLAGAPLHVDSDSQSAALLRLPSGIGAPVTVPPAGEFLRLHCDRFRVLNGTLRFQSLEKGWYPAIFYPREEGVLALWCEWRPSIRVFDLWVLAEGGPAVFGPTPRPAEWPSEAPWRPPFERRILCVSRASWRLENL